jgi:hypothetical protein
VARADLALWILFVAVQTLNLACLAASWAVRARAPRIPASALMEVLRMETPRGWVRQVGRPAGLFGM